MAEITQAALDKAEGVTSTDQIAKDVPNTDQIVQADGDFLFLKMAGMVPITQATIAALKVGLSGSGSVAAATTSAAGIVKQIPLQSNAGQSTATDVAGLVTDHNALATKYNALLAALSSAGIMAAK